LVSNDFVDLGDARDDDAKRAETPPSAADEDAASEGIATNARGMEAARWDARVIVSRRALPAPAACALHPVKVSNIHHKYPVNRVSGTRNRQRGCRPRLVIG
jgi:hypothetical protein